MALSPNSTFTTVNQNVTTSTNTVSFTNTSGNGLLVGITRRDEGDVVTGCTYGGVAMTLVAKKGSEATNFGYVFYLNSPATGANNIVVTSSATGSDIFITGLSYSGADTTSAFINASATTSGSSGTTITGSVTPTVANCWTVMYVNSDLSSVAASTNSTVRGAGLGGNNFAFFDSNGTVTSGSSFSMSVTQSSGPYSLINIAIAPAASVVAKSGFFFAAAR